jgi:BASS family bile acid:Na+ symporter
MMAAPALAALMGLDATLVMATLIASTALIPFTAALFAEVFIGPALVISSMELGLKLLAMLVGSAVVGLTLRRLAGVDRIERHKMPIDGFNILVLLVFVAGLMENVAPNLLARPLFTLGLCALAFISFALVLGATALLFRSAGWEKALSLGFMASQRNTGLMVAATSGALPELAWLYFGLAQFPIYLSPQVLKPLVRRVLPGLPNPTRKEAPQ